MTAPSASLTPAQAQALWREGGQALRGGDAAGALQRFRRIVEGGREDAVVWLGVAVAANRAGDSDAALAAADQVLAREPQNIRALMLKGDHFAGGGDPLGAASFYDAVVRIADSGPIAGDLATEVARARDARAAHTRALDAHLEARLRSFGVDRPEARRIRESLELMRGAKDIFLQQPSQHYFPGLPQIQFYEREATPWLTDVEAAFTDVREELDAVLAEESGFAPYVERQANRATVDRHGLVGDPSWSAFYLVKAGEAVAGNAERCPKTLAALDAAPLCAIPGRTPAVLFSLLRPGARIPPHCGLLNSRLICHLPLIVPEGCRFRVGNETRAWREGEAFAFDDSIEHEAWNNSGARRTVLIFDVWRPELSLLERELVSVIVQASRTFSAEAA